MKRRQDVQFTAEAATVFADQARVVLEIEPDVPQVWGGQI